MNEEKDEGEEEDVPGKQEFANLGKLAIDDADESGIDMGKGERGLLGLYD